MQLRRGQPEAIDVYQDQERIVEVDRDSLTLALYEAWRADAQAGLTSLMITPDDATVAELNRRARADRVVSFVYIDAYRSPTFLERRQHRAGAGEGI